MASKSLGVLTIDLIAKVGGFTEGLGRAERETNKRAAAIERRMRKMGDVIGKGLKAAAAVAVASLGAISVGVKRAIDAADELGKMSQRTGISVEALSRLEVAASQSDTSLESLQKSIVNLGRAQLEARKGSEEQVALFKALGVEISDLQSLSPDQLLKRIADAFQATADSPEKAAVAMKLFGRAGAELIPLLNGGSEQLERFDRLSDELGNTLSTETALAAAEFNDKLDLVQTGLNGVWRTAAADLLPTLNKLAEDFNDPRFREGFASLVTGAVEATVAVAGLLSEIGNVTRFVGEELARQTVGPGLQDLQEIEAQITSLEQRLEKRQKRPGRVGLFADTTDQLKAELELLKKRRQEAIELAKFMEDQAKKRGGDKPMPAADAPKPAGIDFDAWQKAIKQREAAASAAAAARRSEAEATRAQAEADRLAAQAQREAEAASADFLRVTEDLRAELGGPLAQVQLEYIRREDELVRLGNLAGLTQEELASSLELLEQARLRDVEAIEKQIKAQKDFEQSLKDRPLIEQMDQLRDTTAGFFADLLKNGKDAIDRLQEYLLGMALESIGRQIAEGLFGEFGTTGSGGKSNWLSGLLGSFFGGARASGGPVLSGVPYLVGEKGPELVVPNASGTVIPAAQTAALMGRGMSVGKIEMHTHGATSRQSIERQRMQLERALRKANREFS